MFKLEFVYEITIGRKWPIEVVAITYLHLLGNPIFQHGNTRCLTVQVTTEQLHDYRAIILPWLASYPEISLTKNACKRLCQLSGLTAIF